MWQITVLFYARTEAFVGKGSSPIAGLKSRISDVCSSEVNKDILRTGGGGVRAKRGVYFNTDVIVI